MKIALVTETYPPEINGVAMTLSQLASSMRQRGHYIQVTRPLQRDEEQITYTNESEVRVYGFPIPNYPEMRLGIPSQVRLIREWRNNMPDIVHVATEGPLGISAIRAAKKLGLPVISSFHTNFHNYSEYYGASFLSPLVLAFLRWVHNNTECSMFPTQELADQLANKGFNDTFVFGRGVNLNTFNPQRRSLKLRAKWKANDDTLVIVHVSRLAAEKNYDLLLRCYEAISRRKPDTRIVIVGSGPVENQLRRMFPNAIFTGPISLDNREALAEIYASSDFFIYPSTTETYGNVLTESMACGNAVLAYDYAAAAMHVRSQENGVTVPLGDEDAFITASIEIATNEKKRKKLGIEAVKTSANFEWEPVIDRYEALLKKHLAL
ncbi:glycosyltransferase family 1 protein [Puniceicoccaceae bacterium K14]|nr:glycosyltransferase family 1 protein [Puniceicoccaceae bacterium K14]